MNFAPDEEPTPRIEPLEPEKVEDRLPELSSAEGYLEERVAEIPDEYIAPYQDKDDWESIAPYAGHHPYFLEHLYQGDIEIYTKGRIDERLSQLIAMLISQPNECIRCIPIHAGAAIHAGATKEETDIIRNFEHRKDELPDDERKVLEFSLKAAKNPETVTDEDVEELRQGGYNDEEIVEIAAIALHAYQFSAFNSIFNLK